MSASVAIAIIDGLSSLLQLVTAQAVAARERGEWTPEESAAFDAKLENLTNQPHWKP